MIHHHLVPCELAKRCRVSQILRLIEHSPYWGPIPTGSSRRTTTNIHRQRLIDGTLIKLSRRSQLGLYVSLFPSAMYFPAPIIRSNACQICHLFLRDYVSFCGNISAACIKVSLLSLIYLVVVQGKRHSE